jgi:Predicted metal-binding integral membrane protein (DUF2182)
MGVETGLWCLGCCIGLTAVLVALGMTSIVWMTVVGAVIFVYQYDDDEHGSPWSLVLHVDARGNDAQRAALERVFLDELRHLPWIRKVRHIVAVRESAIEAGEDGVRIGSMVVLRAGRPVETTTTVTCIVPGHDHVGRELYADKLTVDDSPFVWELAGNCAYAADFDYASR